MNALGIISEIAAQRNRALLWFPVCLGIGIYIYFSLMVEPTFMFVQGLCIAAIVGACLGWVWQHPLRWVIFVCVWIVIGFLLGSLRAHSVAAPVLGWRYYGAITGQVVAIDRSSSNKQRITLAVDRMGKISKPRTPKYVRVSLHSKDDNYVPEAGDVISVIANVTPPSAPSEPYGFDFQRRSWFHQLGAVGYSRKPVDILDRGNGRGFHHRVFQTRMAISAHIQSRVNGGAGAFASAILTGNRANIDPADLRALRKSNLAHLLAISGLHMGLLTSVVFAIARYSLALWPWLNLRIKTKKIAAILALLAGASYLMLSGSAVATQRAFIMVSVMLIAILLDRPAISLRAVAMAAVIILGLWPENLMEPGFQMSFAATIALIVCFDGLKHIPFWRAMGRGGMRFLQPVLGLLISSLVAGFATAPFAAYHFNQVAHYGLIANMSTLPIMGMIVMPSAVMAAILTPIGLDGVPFWIMGLGIDWILSVANWVSNLRGAVSRVPDAGPYALPFIAIGAVFIIMFSKTLRIFGLTACLCGGLFWKIAPRPDILVSHDGRLVGAMSPQGRMLNRKRGSGYAATNWLENDGDLRTRQNTLISGDPDLIYYTLAGQKITYLWDTKSTFEQLEGHCDRAEIVLAPKWKEDAPKGCQFFGYYDFRDMGALSFQNKNGVLNVKTARQSVGMRVWNNQQRGFKRRN
ncbi:hypothetical protein GCM10008927_01600 [Amylibacter ulvae]|uniref:Competence protein n=1 Tax=Paramylibacter ulvae TaxID=1651968 RepID=A0ABQ3CTN9_9RHOB|nr:hypothetical protein GCM10008927_01600 [Amylibacter ulvae]